jgi:hypothetical protein
VNFGRSEKEPKKDKAAQRIVPDHAQLQLGCGSRRLGLHASAGFASCCFFDALDEIGSSSPLLEGCGRASPCEEPCASRRDVPAKGQGRRWRLHRPTLPLLFDPQLVAGGGKREILSPLLSPLLFPSVTQSVPAIPPPPPPRNSPSFPLPRSSDPAEAFKFLNQNILFPRCNPHASAALFPLPPNQYALLGQGAGGGVLVDQCSLSGCILERFRAPHPLFHDPGKE